MDFFENCHGMPRNSFLWLKLNDHIASNDMLELADKFAKVPPAIIQNAERTIHAEKKRKGMVFYSHTNKTSTADAWAASIYTTMGSLIIQWVLEAKSGSDQYGCSVCLDSAVVNTWKLHCFVAASTKSKPMSQLDFKNIIAKTLHL